MAKLNGTGPILIVDDNTDALRIVKIVFGDSNVRNAPITLRSGKELIAYMDGVRSGENEAPSLILLDVNMPLMDGAAALSALRAMPEFRTTPEVVMLTSSDDSFDREKFEALGANGYQVKPLDINDYIDFANSLIP